VKDEARMAYDPQNPFARILRGELPCVKVHEDAYTLAIMDIMPQSDGHVLVITKEPAETLLELSAESTSAAILTTRRLARAVKRALEVPGIMIVQVNGREAGQTVPHVHFHIIPRRAGEELRMHATTLAPPETLTAHAERIRTALSETTP
jgi:histidine triad (HIT) family protein